MAIKEEVPFFGDHPIPNGEISLSIIARADGLSDRGDLHPWEALDPRATATGLAVAAARCNPGGPPSPALADGPDPPPASRAGFPRGWTSDNGDVLSAPGADAVHDHD